MHVVFSAFNLSALSADSIDTEFQSSLRKAVTEGWTSKPQEEEGTRAANQTPSCVVSVEIILHVLIFPSLQLRLQYDPRFLHAASVVLVPLCALGPYSACTNTPDIGTTTTSLDVCGEEADDDDNIAHSALLVSEGEAGSALWGMYKFMESNLVESLLLSDIL